jgi:hypothetical protein
MEMYTKALAWTLHQLSKDHELEEFVAGIPDLYESSDIVTAADIPHSDVQLDIQPLHVQRDIRGHPHHIWREVQLRYAAQRNIRRVLAYLPGPTSFDAPLSWSILRLAQRVIFGNLSKPKQHKRVQTCLRALYHIPGAIRDLLTPYAAEEDLSRFTLGLLNTQESLEIIEELWDIPNDDVALSVRTASAAVVAAFMITPVTVGLNVVFIGNHNTGKQFLAKRLRDGIRKTLQIDAN